VAKNGTIAYVSQIPDCDVCKDYYRNWPSMIRKAQYDAKTASGPWANLCEFHWKLLTYQKLGLGLGQKLEVRRK